MDKTIKVKVAEHRKGDARAILNDQDERHPKEGHVFITGETTGAVEVGDTPRVREVIALGDLVLVEEKKTDGKP